MNTETIREYAELMKEYNLATLEIEEGESKIKLERRPKMPKGRPPMDMPPGCAPMPPMPQARPERERAYPSEEGFAYLPEGARTSAPAPSIKGETITSPMVGVFYQASAENADPYVQIGDTVKKGDTLCIIEAMKLMNEITAERDGKIVDILVQNGDVVEYGTPLFVME